MSSDCLGRNVVVVLTILILNIYQGHKEFKEF